MKRLRALWLAILLTVSAASSTGLAVAGMGASPTRDISSVPGLAQALAHRRPIHPQHAVSAVNVSVPETSNTLPLGIINIAPGQSITREAIIKDTGNIVFRTVTVRIQVMRSSLLLTDQSQGLTLALAVCDPACIPFVNRPLATLIGHSVTHSIALRPGQSLRLVAMFSLPQASTLSSETGLLNFSGVLSA